MESGMSDEQESFDEERAFAKGLSMGLLLRLQDFEERLLKVGMSQVERW